MGTSQHGNQPKAFLSYPLNFNGVLAPLILCIGHVPSRNTLENLAEKPDYTTGGTLDTLPRFTAWLYLTRLSLYSLAV
jgi:hypothetical protein